MKNLILIMAASLSVCGCAIIDQIKHPENYQQKEVPKAELTPEQKQQEYGKMIELESQKIIMVKAYYSKPARAVFRTYGNAHEDALAYKAMLFCAENNGGHMSLKVLSIESGKDHKGNAGSDTTLCGQSTCHTFAGQYAQYEYYKDVSVECSKPKHQASN